jgi:hypothetical protein
MSHRHTNLFSHSHPARLCEFTNSMQRSINVYCRPLLSPTSSDAQLLRALMFPLRCVFNLFRDLMWLVLVNRIMHLRIP